MLNLTPGTTVLYKGCHCTVNENIFEPDPDNPDNPWQWINCGAVGNFPIRLKDLTPLKD